MVVRMSSNVQSLIFAACDISWKHVRGWDSVIAFNICAIIRNEINMTCMFDGAQPDFSLWDSFESVINGNIYANAVRDLKFSVKQLV